MMLCLYSFRLEYIIHHKLITVNTFYSSTKPKITTQSGDFGFVIPRIATWNTFIAELRKWQTVFTV